MRLARSQATARCGAERGIRSAKARTDRRCGRTRGSSGADSGTSHQASARLQLLGHAHVNANVNVGCSVQVSSARCRACRSIIGRHAIGSRRNHGSGSRRRHCHSRRRRRPGRVSRRDSRLSSRASPLSSPTNNTRVHAIVHLNPALALVHAHTIAVRRVAFCCLGAHQGFRRGRRPSGGRHSVGRFDAATLNHAARQTQVDTLVHLSSHCVALGAVRDAMARVASANATVSCADLGLGGQGCRDSCQERDAAIVLATIRDTLGDARVERAAHGRANSSATRNGSQIGVCLACLLTRGQAHTVLVTGAAVSATLSNLNHVALLRFRRCPCGSGRRCSCLHCRATRRLRAAFHASPKHAAAASVIAVVAAGSRSLTPTPSRHTRDDRSCCRRCRSKARLAAFAKQPQPAASKLGAHTTQAVGAHATVGL